MIRRPPRSTPLDSSAASDVYKRQGPDHKVHVGAETAGWFTHRIFEICPLTLRPSGLRLRRRTWHYLRTTANSDDPETFPVNKEVLSLCAGFREFVKLVLRTSHPKAHPQVG